MVCCVAPGQCSSAGEVFEAHAAACLCLCSLGGRDCLLPGAGEKRQGAMLTKDISLTFAFELMQGWLSGRQQRQERV